MGEVKKLKEIISLIDLIATAECKLEEILNDYDKYLSVSDSTNVTRHTNHYIKQLINTLYTSARRALDEVD